MQRIASIVLIALGVLVCARGHAVGSETEQAGRANVALLTLANYTLKPEAAAAFEPALRSRLEELGLGVVEQTELRRVLRAHRIRAVGEIGVAGAAALQADLGVEYVLTGSYDVFQATDEIPEAALSLRVIELSSLRIVWARSAGATGADYEALFGLGKILATDDLAGRLVEEATAGLTRALQGVGEDLGGLGTAVAVVPFDDVVLESPGRGIVSAQMLTHLVQRGFRVLEPGVMRELLLKYQRYPRGGIDYELLHALNDSLGVQRVITGAVDQLRFGIPSVEQSFPSVSVNGRVIDTETGRILRVADVSANGNTEVLLGMGYKRSAAVLTRSVTSALLNKLHLREGGRDAS